VIFRGKDNSKNGFSDGNWWDSGLSFCSFSPMYLEVGSFCVSELYLLMRAEDLSDFKLSFDEEFEGISSRDFRDLNKRALVSMKS
jgi:hypothetical protein